jgi:two-component system sensor histidine kinase DegS
METGPLVSGQTAELSGLLGQVLEAYDAERCALSHRLQEHTGQALAALALQLRVLERHCTDADLARRIAESRAVVADALHDLESLLLTLYPPALEEQGLGPALEVFVQEFVQLAQIHVALDLEILPKRLPSGVEVGLFRVVQDGLQAVCQQPMVSAVRIVLRQYDATLSLTLLVDGAGYSPDVLDDWNFVRMRRRAESLGAECAISLTPDGGARIQVTLPLVIEIPHHDQRIDR